MASSRRSLSPPARRSLAPFLKRSPSMDPHWGAALKGASPRAKPILPYCTSPSQLESIMYDAEDSSDSPFLELLQNQPTANSMSGRTVKQFEEELRILKKENFNLKLRIYFLEERMQKLGKPLGDSEGAEKKLIELKVQMETLRREMQSKQMLLAQAGKAIELMEEQHAAEMDKLRKEMEQRPVTHPRPMENSMALYADAFDLPSSFLMPPPPPPGRGSKTEKQDPEVVESMQQQINDLEFRLQNVSDELIASQERERQLNDALESKAPEIQIKVQELCYKDKLLEDQRKIIVEIQIRLDEKQKELETLRQSLDMHQSSITKMEQENRSLDEKLRESEEKREKSVKVVQTLVTKNKELQHHIVTVEEKLKNMAGDQIGEMHQEENEHLWTELECQRRQVERMTKENGDLLREKAAAEAKLHEEISELKLLLAREQTGRQSVVPAEIGSTAFMMMGRLGELASFLATLLKRPHLLTSFSAAHRQSLLQLVEQSWGNARQQCSTISASMLTDVTADFEATALSTAAHEESLIGQIQAFLKGPEQQEFMLEVEAHKEKNCDFWPVSLSNDLDSGKEIELARWSLDNKVQPPPRPPRKHELEEEDDEEEVGSGATAVEREARGNQSESEAWSEPDRTVSLARIGLPENKTPVNQAMSSPASSELDQTPRTPGKKASYKKLVHRLHTTEQINEALLVEVSGYKALLKSHSEAPPSPANPLQQSLGVSVTSEMLQELEFQRARLEKMLQQNEVMRYQLEVSACVAKGDEGVSSLIRRLTELQEKLQKSEALVAQLELQLKEVTAQLGATESQLRERDQLHAQLQQVQLETQEALASMENTKAAMQEEILQTRRACLQLEEKAQRATDKCRQLEDASKQDLERCELLARQVEEAQQHCMTLTQQITQIDVTKSVAAAEHSTAPSSLIHLSDSDETFNGTGSVPHSGDETRRHTLSSPDLGIESDTGRSLECKEDEKGRLSQENWQLKQKLAESQRIMEKCLEALNKKNRDRQKVQASMEKQLLRTEEVLIKASRNLKLLPSSPKTP